MSCFPAKAHQAPSPDVGPGGPHAGPRPGGPASIEPTLHPGEAADIEWPAVVVGAGPAGAVTALVLARAGRRVLLLDRATFPRSKVCGCCLGRAALDLLASMSLGSLPQRCGAVPLHTVELAAGERSVRLALPASRAVSRHGLDAALVQEAIGAGAAFLPGTAASIGESNGHSRSVGLRVAGGTARLRAELVVLAAGLRPQLPADAVHLRPRAVASSRIGASALLPAAAESGPFERGLLTMACAREGYVGLVRLEDGSLDVAAALDPIQVKRAGSMAAAVDRILTGAGVATPAGLDGCSWRGTPRLSQRARGVAADRLLLVGDAAAYVEPFTGEGIGWALASGRAAGAGAAEALGEAPAMATLARRWRREHRRLLGGRLHGCGLAARALRHPRLVRAAVSLFRRAPGLTARAIGTVQRPFPPA